MFQGWYDEFCANRKQILKTAATNYPISTVSLFLTVRPTINLSFKQIQSPLVTRGIPMIQTKKKRVFFGSLCRVQFYLLPSSPGHTPGDLQFFLTWRSIPHPRARRKRQFPTLGTPHRPNEGYYIVLKKQGHYIEKEN